ncbi:methionine aminopeptidase [Enterocytozoon bieneusi H348]|nr:methionine aminopeptidase [Enterocytozoon bieneusi H348]|eukprot:XP_002650008.1 methionine aminopeptidase [Enterocytozoon bieneusi H348]
MILINPVQEKPIEFLDKTLFNTTSDTQLNDIMRAAEAHKRIRGNLQKILKPGCSVREIIKYVEDSTRIMLHGEKNNGIGFPCGVSLNNVAAHFSLNPWNEDIILTKNDVLKIDFGTHSNGRIVDSAFSVSFDEKYTNLLLATKEATERGIKVIGIDMAVCEIGKEISEVFKSFEFEENGKMINIKPIWNLNGHSIDQYKIHAGISIPSINNGDYSRITPGFFAIETFASTGIGEIKDYGECSHFALASRPTTNKIYDKKNEEILNLIKKEFGTLPFSHQHLLYYTQNAKAAVQLLAARKFIDSYPPLVDIPKSYVAQFEHTLYITEKSKFNISKGDDY